MTTGSLTVVYMIKAPLLLFWEQRGLFVFSGGAESNFRPERRNTTKGEKIP